MKRILAILFALVAVSSLLFVSCAQKELTADSADFIMSNGAEPTLDPTIMTDVGSTNIALGLFEGLVTYDPKTTKGLNALAESYTVSADGLTYTFKMRKSTWSDGTAVTAQDFVNGMKRILDPATGAEYAYMPAMVIKGAADFNGGKGSFDNVGIKAVDKNTVEYTLTGPAPYFYDMLAHTAFYPIPQWAIDKAGNDWTKPENIVTNGPYLLKEWKPQEYVFMVKNAKYWDAKNVKLKGIKVLASDNDSTNYNMFKNGEVDWMHGIALSKIDEIKLRPDYQASAQVGTYYYALNVQRAPVNNVLVRKALAAAIDKKTLVDKITKGGQIPTDSWVAPMAGYTVQPGEGFNVEQAQKYLAEAGFPGGKGFPKLSIIYNTNEGHKAIGEYIQQQWKQNLGIDVTLQNMEFKTFLDLRANHQFTIARHGWIGDYLDPNTFLDLFMTDGGNNDGDYRNADYDALIQKASTSSGAERMKLLEQAEAMYITRDQAMIPIYHYSNQDLIDLTKWDGWYPTPLGFHPWKFISKK
jgi:oligopeptide transport system substrate-binding protein